MLARIRRQALIAAAMLPLSAAVHGDDAPANLMEELVRITSDPLGDLDGDADVDLRDYAIFEASFTGPGLAAEICGDGEDNDRDGFVDCADPDCDGQPCGALGALCIDSLCQCPGEVEICNDGVDNDCDGLVDCADVADCPPGAPCGANRACGSTGDCVCTTGYGDCDGQPDNGCETNLRDSPCDCGACGQPCDLPNAYADCINGDCEIALCERGWCDADGVDANGCEFYIYARPPCSEYVYLGEISGDVSSEPLVHEAVGEAWYRIDVRETDNILAHPLGVTITLNMPLGGDYDVNVYCPNCATFAERSANYDGAPETTTIGWVDNPLSPDHREIYIEVQAWRVIGCGDYELIIDGNTPGPNNCPG